MKASCCNKLKRYTCCKPGFNCFILRIYHSTLEAAEALNACFCPASCPKKQNRKRK